MGISKAYFNKNVSKQLNGTKDFYWSESEECHRKSSISACFGGSEKQRWTLQGERMVWEKTEKGKQSEFNRAGSHTTGRNLECEENKRASFNEHKRLAAVRKAEMQDFLVGCSVFPHVICY